MADVIEMNGIRLEIETVSPREEFTSRKWSWLRRRIRKMIPDGEGLSVILPTRKMAERARAAVCGMSCKPKGSTNLDSRPRLPWPKYVKTRCDSISSSDRDGETRFSVWVENRSDET